MDSDVRRSNRLKVRNKGFKQDSCGKTNYLSCSSEPPIISNFVIRDLGKELCQIDPEMLTDDFLMKKEEVGAIGASKKENKTPKSKKNNDKSSTRKNNG